MPETVSPDDLAMYRRAVQDAQQTERAVQQLQQAQQQHLAALGALEFVRRTIADRYGLTQGGSFHPETGAIVRPAVATDASRDPELHDQANTRRKKDRA